MRSICLLVVLLRQSLSALHVNSQNSFAVFCKTIGETLVITTELEDLVFSSAKVPASVTNVSLTVQSILIRAFEHFLSR